MPAASLMHAAMLMAMTPEEIGELLDMHGSSVRRLIRQGRLKAFKQKKPGLRARLMVPGWAVMAFQHDECERTVRQVMTAVEALTKAA